MDKPGYRLIFQDEFDAETLDDSRWVPQYLSSWAQKPELAEPTYIMENGLMRLQIFAETQPWCPEYDGETVVSGFTTRGPECAAQLEWNECCAEPSGNAGHTFKSVWVL